MAKFGFGTLVVAAMALDALALPTIPPSRPADADYDAVYAAVMATLRGRWFLEEYARRSRSADTRLILDAIERIEGVVRRGQSQEADQGVRIDLLEMAKTIAQTRADIAEMPVPDDQIKANGGAKTEPKAARSKTEAPIDILAAAERLQDVVWTMRERGVDMATCDQIADVADAIRAAPLLREGSERRAQRLGEVLKYLERRIDGMLAASRLVPANEPRAATTADLKIRAVEPAPGHAGPEASADPLAEVTAAMAALIQSRNAAIGRRPDSLPPTPAEPPCPLTAEPAAATSEPDQEGEPASTSHDALFEPIMPSLVAAPAEPDPAASAVPPTAAPHDPLAALKAMSEEERIALFT